jgi:hypothetical protein
MGATVAILNFLHLDSNSAYLNPLAPEKGPAGLLPIKSAETFRWRKDSITTEYLLNLSISDVIVVVQVSIVIS